MHITESVIIERPCGEVFAYVADVRNDPAWQRGVTSVQVDGPPGVGGRVTQVRNVLGRQVEGAAICTRFESERAIAFEGASDGVTYHGEITFAEVDLRTTVAFAITVRLGRLLMLTTPLVTRQVKEDLRASLTTLKDLLEAPRKKGAPYQGRNRGLNPLRSRSPYYLDEPGYRTLSAESRMSDPRARVNPTALSTHGPGPTEILDDLSIWSLPYPLTRYDLKVRLLQRPS